MLRRCLFRTALGAHGCSVAAAVNFSVHRSQAASSAKPRWGDWSEPASSKAAGGEQKHEDEDVDRINYYDSKKFMGRHRGATVICKQKPIVRSFVERAYDYLRPKGTKENSWIDSLQLVKLFAYLLVPVLFLIYFKSAHEDLPNYWEEQVSKIHARPINEEGGKTKSNYFEIIGSLEEKRATAMGRKGYSPSEIGR